MAIKQVTKFVADDGEAFDTLKEATWHELAERFNKALNTDSRRLFYRESSGFCFIHCLTDFYTFIQENPNLLNDVLGWSKTYGSS